MMVKTLIAFPDDEDSFEEHHPFPREPQNKSNLITKIMELELKLRERLRQVSLLIEKYPSQVDDDLRDYAMILAETYLSLRLWRCSYASRYSLDDKDTSYFFRYERG